MSTPSSVKSATFLGTAAKVTVSTTCPATGLKGALFWSFPALESSLAPGKFAWHEVAPTYVAVGDEHPLVLLLVSLFTVCWAHAPHDVSNKSTLNSVLQPLIDFIVISLFSR